MVGGPDFGVRASPNHVPERRKSLGEDCDWGSFAAWLDGPDDFAGETVVRIVIEWTRLRPRWLIGGDIADANGCWSFQLVGFVD